MKQFVVFGLGSFGSAVATTLTDLGHEVLGVDNDPDAIQVSRENAIKNNTGENTNFEEWSVAELLEDGIESQLVVANIIAPILQTLFSDGMSGLGSPGGSLILSGILKEQLPGIKDQLKNGKFLIKAELENEGWYALWGEKILEK